MMLGQCFSFCVFTRPGPIAADLRRCINSAATWGTPAIKSNYSSVTATRGPCGPQNWLSLIQDVKGRPGNAAPPTRQNLCAELLAFDHLAILLHEPPDWILQKIDHRLRWPAQSYALRCHHDRTVDQDRMGHHDIQQFIVRPFGVVQVELLVGCALLAQQSADGEAHGCYQILERLARRRRLEVFDD